ncbi:hypothetical protein FHT80_002086 [Rhizobium sp. BK226]|uniref:hypothetical protein n=1 Tax=Rhizobium sp. BK226 TaxID=2587075 RepID=UPI00161CD5C9|nr:hypothetical protein [Rhizobium sp. BK226]MBB4112767.1 hypothetical protein [Rhizobium sp. BK226]
MDTNWQAPIFAQILTADSLSALGSLVSATVAIFAFLYAKRKVTEARKHSREVQALEAYSAYLERCIQRPELSSWDMFLKHCDKGLGPVAQAMTKDSEAYLWFVSTLITVCDQILVDVPESKIWKPTLERQLSYHDDLLLQTWSEWRNGYHPRTKDLVDRVLLAKRQKLNFPWKARASP